ncbi:MAG: EAL domain-containing protein [Spirochaetia bacterium]
MGNTYEYIVNHSRDFITLINRDYCYEIVNDSYCDTMEKERSEILGKSVAEIWGKDQFQSNIKQKLDQCFQGKEVHYIDQFRFGNRKKHMHVSFYPYKGNGDSVSHVLVFSHDITKLSEIESKLEDYANKDPITGLFNRRSLKSLLEKELEKAKRSDSDKNRVVMFVALKNFKEINRSHGHTIGDLLLENTALRIKDCIRKSDMVFRFEGSNLVVLLTSVSKATDAAVVAWKLWDAVSLPYRYKGMVITVNCYIGVSIFPEDSSTPQDLIEKANSASVEAEKENDPFLLYDRSLHEKAMSRMTLLSELRHAFERKQLEIYYQPVVAVENGRGRIVGAEALIRWNHPKMGMLVPSKFIDLAEDSGLVKAVDKWALYQVCEQLKQWTNKHDFFCSINISTKDLTDDNLIPVISGAVKNTGIKPESLKLEITESRCMENPEQSVARIQALKQIGVEIWIDDFGTGQSSLGYLKRLPIDTLKIDRTFIEDILLSEEERKYLESIIGSIRARGKEIIVEGVSSAKHSEVLYEMGCRLMQGFYFGRPVPAKLFNGFMKKGGLLPLD